MSHSDLRALAHPTANVQHDRAQPFEVLWWLLNSVLRIVEGCDIVCSQFYSFRAVFQIDGGTAIRSGKEAAESETVF